MERRIIWLLITRCHQNDCKNLLPIAPTFETFEDAGLEILFDIVGILQANGNGHSCNNGLEFRTGKNAEEIFK